MKRHRRVNYIVKQIRLHLLAAGIGITDNSHRGVYEGWCRLYGGSPVEIPKRDLGNVLVSLYQTGVAEIQNRRRRLSPFRSKAGFLVEGVDVKSDEFLRTRTWRELRYEILQKHGAACQCCGRSRHNPGVVIHVDHIKPRHKHPELALDPNNLQVLCDDCNIGKGAWDHTDWRRNIRY